ncbi:family 43 glycosylhydrolase [Azohydromonas australica]|uniref:family 43 glycosylhydrolase n=1 Tax=Azohydromonas australica TaxID=364039 RepID=UPI00146A6679|nr:immunoglobulin domain-containing protein [Azohydromonas australica]
MPSAFHSTVRFTKPASTIAAACLLLVNAGCGGGSDAPPPVEGAATTLSATLNNFILDDPLAGDNGLPQSPAKTTSYGQIAIGMDVDGNAIQAVDEVDLQYFEGKYYLYGPSFTCGSFNYSPGVNTGPLIPTNPNSTYRYCGLTVYVSDDLMNWKLLGTNYIQDPVTGEHYYVKKPRVVYSPKTGLYNMWFLNGQAALSQMGRTGKQYVTQSATPYGPWSTPFEPVIFNSAGPVDFALATGPDGKSYMATSHGVLTTAMLNDEKTGTVDRTDISVANNAIGGGVGLSYRNGWWYLTGTNTCGNCLASNFYYLRARDPHGPWLSPADDSSAAPLTPVQLSSDSGYAQMKAPFVLPDSKGATQILLPGTRYISNPLGAPSTSVSQAGDNNLALAGWYTVPLEFDDQGRILPLGTKPSYQFPLAKATASSPMPTYQANLGIDSSKSVVQSWDLKPGETLAAVLPSIFQRTPDKSPAPAVSATIQEPFVNAPLQARLQLPNGLSYSWEIDSRTVAWAPSKVPLNLPQAYTGGGRVTLTLSANATNGGYGVAVGKKGALLNGQYVAVKAGTSTPLPDAEILLSTSATTLAPPRITAQPKSIRVSAGSNVGFTVLAEGVGLGYQWQRNGQIIFSPNGYNESTTAALRLSSVTTADSGTYTVTVMNQVGAVTSVPVMLQVTP